MFPPGTSVMFIRSTGEPVLAQVVGHSEHGDAYRRISYDRDGKTVLHDRASVRSLSLPRAPSPPRPAQSEASSSPRAQQRALVHRRLKWYLQALLFNSDSREDDEVEIVWAKATRGGWGLGQIFEDKLFFTRDVMDDSFVPNNWKPKPVPQPAPKRAPPMRCARCTWCTRAHASGR
eukprot:CAMPEP_0174378438 /NCGR_PEP_ID=MMETSP0811_2-20130205/122049_1 /TAXON_ID=73025 ORGANISM="Eutreptiella gymnastica-like, Strain CCMP1594" /NCGR_SAMPLE_ID=MMETSP0811_2 /ASSEMBLY_ACC=CAM_ASM_000667 /LENGTH=175 /DNA_ID=CAMNT_0015530657 /DNA_START=967 /DNA_END=1491 /DNA_ORIENTATION=-